MGRAIPVGYLILVVVVIFNLIRMVLNTTVYDHEYYGVVRAALSFFVGLISLIAVCLLAFMVAAKWAFVLPE